MRGTCPAPGVQAGDTVDIVVRPEHVRVVDLGPDGGCPDDHNRWRGVLDAQLFLGPVTQLRFAGAPALTLSVPAERQYLAGAAYHVSWPVERTHVFPVPTA